MRIFPIAVWAAELSDEEFLRAITAEVELTHPNKIVHCAAKVYSMCIKILLNNSKDENKVIKDLDKCLNLSIEDGCDYEDPCSAQTIYDWMNLAFELYQKVDHNNLTKF